MEVAPAAESRLFLGCTFVSVGFAPVGIPILTVEPHLHAVLAPTAERSESGIVFRIVSQKSVGRDVLKRARRDSMLKIALAYVPNELAKGGGVQGTAITVKPKSSGISSDDKPLPRLKEANQSRNELSGEGADDWIVIRNVFRVEAEHPHIIRKQIGVFRVR